MTHTPIHTHTNRAYILIYILTHAHIPIHMQSLMHIYIHTLTDRGLTFSTHTYS